jgi:hypothetical protein
MIVETEGMILNSYWKSETFGHISDLPFRPITSGMVLFLLSLTYTCDTDEIGNLIKIIGRTRSNLVT